MRCKNHIWENIIMWKAVGFMSWSCMHYTIRYSTAIQNHNTGRNTGNLKVRYKQKYSCAWISPYERGSIELHFIWGITGTTLAFYYIKNGRRKSQRKKSKWWNSSKWNPRRFHPLQKCTRFSNEGSQGAGTINKHNICLKSIGVQCRA